MGSGNVGRFGPASSNWRGGRSITPHGYVLIRVGTGHHLSDVRGYAYEHRLVAEEKIGRRLLPGEIPHHINHDKQDNRPENIEVLPSVAHHFVEHRKPGSKVQRMPGESNPLILCACGCKTKLTKYDKWRRIRKFISGHNLHG